MEAKLIKKSDGSYILRSESGKPLAISIGGKDGCKLSLKNCQAIERGYDLDELIKNAYAKHSVKDDTLSLDEQIQRSGGFNVGYKEGFQKALELLGDKKYSEEDIKRAGSLIFLALGDGGDITTDEVIQSLQQTEWDVEIEMGYQGFEEDGKLIEGYLPKLDAEGCLILKRK